ncbi:hypothetical protein M433DRAFT_545724 [Acidomyces richmondensis BFW]|nr:MAG: hypothetical protein FE78DRAFT_137474 [Acidomyces sp. 'richmondensis']KYG42346.1 hypothetical protein M433DRAFT_545724 [Acidomyces richmondensis BFW]
MWGYHVYDLTEEQKDERRHLLDFYASLAQISIFFPLSILQIYFFLCWIRGRRHIVVPAPSSPSAKEQRRVTTWVSLRNAHLLFQRWMWWCGDAASCFGFGLGGTNGTWLLAATWLAWLLLLCFRQTGGDYFHLTKRFGIVAASQLPWQYLLAVKSPLSPLTLLTRRSHESLNALHQLLGRIIIALLYLHALLYLRFYVSAGLLATKLQQPYIICGLTGIIAFTLIGTSALAPLRKWWYRVFHITHVTLAVALLPLLFFHVRYIRIYLYETAAVLGINAVSRYLSARTHPGRIQIISGTNLVEIDIPAAGGMGQFGRWQPGQHAYVSLAGHPILRTFRSNPFTVASLPGIDGRVRFVARVRDGNTALLARNAHGADVEHPITVEGPYGLATHAEDLLRYDRVLLVAGGVGATFILPIYRQLLMDLSPSKGSYRRRKVSFVWVARTRAEVLWALPNDARERESLVERLKVCITGRVDDLAASASGSLVVDEDDLSETGGETEQGIELEEQKQLLAADIWWTNGQDESPRLWHAGRPDLSRIVEQIFQPGREEKVAVIVCGPRALRQDLRKEVGKWVRRGREVWFWQESFAV